MGHTSELLAEASCRLKQCTLWSLLFSPLKLDDLDPVAEDITHIGHRTWKIKLLLTRKALSC